MQPGKSDIFRRQEYYMYCSSSCFFRLRDSVSCCAQRVPIFGERYAKIFVLMRSGNTTLFGTSRRCRFTPGMRMSDVGHRSRDLRNRQVVILVHTFREGNMTYLQP